MFQDRRSRRHFWMADAVEEANSFLGFLGFLAPRLLRSCTVALGRSLGSGRCSGPRSMTGCTIQRKGWMQIEVCGAVTSRPAGQISKVTICHEGMLALPWLVQPTPTEANAERGAPVSAVLTSASGALLSGR